MKQTSCMDGELMTMDAQLAISPVANTQENGIYYYAGGITNLLTTKEGRKRRQAARAERRGARTSAKRDYAAAQKTAAKGMSQSSPIDKAVAASLTDKKAKSAKGLSTTTWVLIGLGGLAVVVGGFFLLRKK